MNDANGAFLLFGSKFAVVESNLRRLHGIDVNSYNNVFLCLMMKDEVWPFLLLDDKLGYFASLGRVFLF